MMTVDHSCNYCGTLGEEKTYWQLQVQTVFSIIYQFVSSVGAKVAEYAFYGVSSGPASIRTAYCINRYCRRSVATHT
jgi:hypothetical protein